MSRLHQIAGPASDAKEITPRDTADLPHGVARSIYVGGAGSLTISPDASTAGVVITAPPVGTILPIELNGGRVMAATTATLLVALA